MILARGEGAFVWDTEGKRHLDLAAGFGSVLLGHGHPAIRDAIATQSEKLIQGLGDVYDSDVKRLLMTELSARFGPPGEESTALIGQAGGDAITAAMKTAALHTGRAGFVAFEGAYHGLGYAPLAACGYNPAFREPFAPQLSERVRFAPYPGIRGATAEASLATLEQIIDDDTAAVIVEPVIGRGGCIVPPEGWLRAVGALCRERGVLVIADEIWTALGRCGAMLRMRDVGCAPDLVCLGKGLGGGLSISACVGPERIMSCWSRAETLHTSTHAGAPLPCSTALATLEVIERESLAERARRVGARARADLTNRLGERGEVRGCGLMIGIQLRDAKTVERATRELLARGFLVISGGVARDALTITPPLTIELEDLQAFGQALADVLS